MMRVHQLMLRRRGLGQYPKPRKRIHTVISLQNVRRNLPATDAVKAVTANQIIAGEIVCNAVVRVVNMRPVGLDLMHAHIGALKQHLPVVCKPTRD